MDTHGTGYLSLASTASIMLSGYTITIYQEPKKQLSYRRKHQCHRVHGNPRRAKARYVDFLTNKVGHTSQISRRHKQHEIFGRYRLKKGNENKSRTPDRGGCSLSGYFELCQF